VVDLCQDLRIFLCNQYFDFLCFSKKLLIAQAFETLLQEIMMEYKSKKYLLSKPDALED